MAMPKPRRWWFAIAVPSAMLLSAAIPLLRHPPFAEDGSLYVIGAMPLAVILGISCFPVGLAALFCRDAVYLHDHFAALVCCGYGVYAVLTLWGIIRPHRIVFIILCILLLANVAGCQLEQVVKSIPILH